MDCCKCGKEIEVDKEAELILGECNSGNLKCTHCYNQGKNIKFVKSFRLYDGHEHHIGYLYLKLTRLEIVNGEDKFWVESMGWSICHKQDRMNAKMGKALARKRLEKGIQIKSTLLDDFFWDYAHSLDYILENMFYFFKKDVKSPCQRVKDMWVI